MHIREEHIITFKQNRKLTDEEIVGFLQELVQLSVANKPEEEVYLGEDDDPETGVRFSRDKGFALVSCTQKAVDLIATLNDVSTVKQVTKSLFF